MRLDRTPWIVMLVVLLALIPLAGVIGSSWTVPRRRTPGDRGPAIAEAWRSDRASRADESFEALQAVWRYELEELDRSLPAQSGKRG